MSFQLSNRESRENISIILHSTVTEIMLAAILLIISGALSAALQQHPANSLTAGGNGPSTLDSSTVLAFNISAGRVLQIECNAPRYGKNLKVPSCKKVLRQIAESDRQVVFADRASVVSHEVPLPYRLQSGQ